MRRLEPSAVPRHQLAPLAALYTRLIDTGISWMTPDAARRACAFSQFTALFIAALPYRRAFERAVSELPAAAIRQVLASVELKFAGFRATFPETQPARPAAPPASVEDYATGASYILTTRNRLVGIALDDLTTVAPSEAITIEVERLITCAQALFQLDEAEVDVFRGGYGCYEIRPLAWTVCAPDELQGKARELGNIETAFQEQVRYERNQKEGIATFLGFAKSLYAAAGSTMFPFVDYPVRRLVMKIGQRSAEYLGASLVRTDRLFSEEISMLEGIAYEIVADLEDVRRFIVADSLSMWNVFLIARLLRLLFLARNEALQEEASKDSESLLRSCLFVLPLDKAVDTICLFGFEKKTVENFMQVFAWDVSNKTSYADLQYRPFVIAGNHVLLPLALAGSSNVLRNVLVVTQKRLSAGGYPDIVTRHLYESILPACAACARNVQFRFRSETSEIDVLFLLDKTLFVCECKNSLKPVSSFEMRATWDQLDKGADQLDRIMRLWREPASASWYVKGQHRVVRRDRPSTLSRA